MKSKYLSFTLAIIAGLLCITAFVVKLMRSETPDYTILFAGVFIIALGIAAWFRRK